MLSQYFTLLLIIEAGQCAIGAVAYLYWDQLEAILYSSWQEDPNAKITISNMTKDTIQNYVGCCGFYNSSDYPNTPCPDNNNLSLPGCQPALMAAFDHYYKFLLASGFAALALQV